MALAQEPINLNVFFSLLSKLAIRLMRERAHGQVVLTFHEGSIVLVEVNRKFKPSSLPEM